MPVPKPEVLDHSPRRLLREIVLERLLAAIDDGTLQPGERLIDDELEAWMGVSRTPIREAIAKLVDYGLVESAANRFTRVATPSAEQLRDAMQVLFALACSDAPGVLERAATSEITQLRDAISAFRGSAASDSRAASLAVITIAGTVVHASSNGLIRELAVGLVPRTRFLTHAQPEGADFGAISLDVIEETVVSRDDDAFPDALAGLGEAFNAALRTE